METSESLFPPQLASLLVLSYTEVGLLHSTLNLLEPSDPVSSLRQWLGKFMCHGEESQVENNVSGSTSTPAPALVTAPNTDCNNPPGNRGPCCWSNTTDYVVKLLLQLTCCVVDKLGRWWLRVKKCDIMSAGKHCIYTQIVWQCDVWQVTPTLQWGWLLICVYTIYGSKFPWLVHSSDGSCKVHAWFQHMPMKWKGFAAGEIVESQQDIPESS